MQVIERKTKVNVSNGTEVQDFKIAATSKAFRILSSGLYSDKILAIVRELSTNAYDSHVAAGCPDKPFDVYLPDYYKRTFRIRDYGIGLTKEQVTQVYTTYFMSDKTDSNEYVGCLGLGSKSPFSYSDNFTVTSYKDGVRYTYSAFINEDGNPSLALLNEGPTTESDGVAVEINVNPSDSQRFVSAAQSVYTWFNTLPNFTNSNVQCNVTKHTVDTNLPHTDKWYFSGNKIGAFAVMGNVAYRLNNLPRQAFEDRHYNLANTPIIINFDIGELDVEASREGISYDKRTIGHIKLKMNEILKEIENQVSKMIGGASCMFEAAAAYQAINRSLGSIQNNIKPIYKNKPIPTHWRIPRDTTKQDKVHMEIQINYMNSYSDTLRKNRYSNTLDVNIPKERIIINDLSRGTQQRVRKLCMDNRSQDYYVITPDDDRTEFNALLDEMGVKEDYFTLSSTLPKPVYAKRATRKGNKNDILKFEYTGYKEKSWVEFQGDMNTAENDNVIYVPISNYAAVIDGANYDIRTLNNIIEAFEILEKEKLTVYGIRKASVEKITKDEDYQLLTDYIKENMKDYNFLCDINDGHTLISSNRHIRRFDNIVAYPRLKNNKKLENIKNELDILRKKYYNVSRELGAFSKLSSLIQQQVQSTTNNNISTEVDNVVTQIEKIITPLVEYGISSYNKDIVDETIGYIELLTK